MNISVCIITKNERAYLDKCLKCLSEYPFEIIVVDTGSEDDSVEVARKYTERVYEFDWCNDFSAARNFSVSKASNDMIMIVDTDEFVETFDYDDFIKVIKNNKEKVGRINLNNVYTRNGVLHSTNEKLSRIFDRRTYKYQGSVHEQIVKHNGENFETYEAPITYRHVGYDGDENKLRDKAMRNIGLLEKELLQKEDPYILYQIGKSYYMLGDYEKALGYFEKATGFDLDPRLEFVVDLVVSYGYTLVNSGFAADAMMFENLYEDFSYSADFVFLMGIIYMNNAVFDGAVAQFEKAKEYKECNLIGVNSYLADYNIGVIFECLGDNKTASKYYLKCGDYEKAKARLEQMG